VTVGAIYQSLPFEMVAAITSRTAVLPLRCSQSNEPLLIARRELLGVGATSRTLIAVLAIRQCQQNCLEFNVLTVSDKKCDRQSEPTIKAA